VLFRKYNLVNLISREKFEKNYEDLKKIIKFNDK
jgi:hypothetical protein